MQNLNTFSLITLSKENHFYVFRTHKYGNTEGRIIGKCNLEKDPEVASNWVDEDGESISQLGDMASGRVVQGKLVAAFKALSLIF